MQNRIVCVSDKVGWRKCECIFFLCKLAGKLPWAGHFPTYLIIHVRFMQKPLQQSRQKSERRYTKCSRALNNRYFEIREESFIAFNRIAFECDDKLYKTYSFIANV